MTTFDIDDFTCPRCHKIQDAVTNAPSNPTSRGPEPGDAIACLYCGSVNVVNEDGTDLRLPTEDEQALFDNDPVVQEAVAIIRRYNQLRN